MPLQRTVIPGNLALRDSELLKESGLSRSCTPEKGGSSRRLQALQDFNADFDRFQRFLRLGFIRSGQPWVTVGHGGYCDNCKDMLHFCFECSNCIGYFGIGLECLC